MHPKEITIAPGGTALILEWADGSVSRIDGRSLRNECRCSQCLSQRRGTMSLNLLSEDSSRIIAVDLPSSSRLSVAWGDRHQKSLYRFSDLIEHFPPERGTTDGER